MNIDDAFVEVRLALGRGHAALARTLLEGILLRDPQNQRARQMLATLGAPLSRSDPRESARPSDLRTPAANKTGNASKSERKRGRGSTICPICKAKIRPGKMAIHNEYYHPRRGTDALDHAVYLSDTAGVAMVKASRKKRGSR
jgi:hypothetical protein